MKWFLVLGAVVVVGAIMQASDRETLRKAHERGLECHVKGGWRTVPTSKIVDFDGERWYFTNGSARRCKVKDIQK